MSKYLKGATYITKFGKLYSTKKFSKHHFSAFGFNNKNNFTTDINSNPPSEILDFKKWIKKIPIIQNH